MSEFSNKWSSRKFATMSVSFAVFTGLLMGEYLEPSIYTVLVGMSLGSYFTANVVEHLKNVK